MSLTGRAFAKEVGRVPEKGERNNVRGDLEPMLRFEA